MSTETPAPIWKAPLVRLSVTEPAPTGWLNTTTRELLTPQLDEVNERLREGWGGLA